MTVSAAERIYTYTGNGATTAFSYPAPFFAASDLVVMLNGEVLTLNSNYTVAGVPASAGGKYISGTINFTAAPTGDIVIYSLTARAQNLDLDNVTQWPMVSVEDALDRAMLIIQELTEAIDRAPHVAPGQDIELPMGLPDPQEGRLLAWSGTPAKLVNVVGSDASTQSITMLGEGGVRTLVEAAAGPNPNDYERMDLEYFLRRQATTAAGQRQALLNAFNEIWHSGGSQGLHLECHRIPLTADLPLRYRTADGLDFTRQGVKISGLHIEADTDGTWTWLDYLFSVAGSDSSLQATKVILDDCYFDINGLPIVALHVAGAFHFSITHPIIRGLGGTDLTDYSIGILNGAYVGDKGEGNNGGTSVSSHGVRVFEADIAIKTGAGADNTSVAMQFERGDADIEGGWCQSTGVGLIAYSGLNIRGFHWSMGLTSGGNRKPGIICRGATELSIHDTELDNTYIVLDSRTNLVGDPDASDASFARIKMMGLKFSVASAPIPASLDLHDGSTTAAAAGLQNGYINFIARQANTGLSSSITLKSDWNNSANGDLLGFAVVGGGTFDTTSIQNIRVENGGGASSLGNLPGDTRLRIAGNNKGELQWQPNWAGPPSGTAAAASRILSIGNDTSAAFIIEGSRVDTTVFSSLVLSNRANGNPDKGLAGFDAFRDGGDQSTKLAFWTMSAGVKGTWATLDKNGVLAFQAGAVIDLDSGTTTASGTGGTSTATLSKQAGVITTDAITTAAGAQHVMTITNTLAASGDICLLTRAGGSNTRMNFALDAVCGASTITVTISNNEPTNAINGNIKFNFVLFKA